MAARSILTPAEESSERIGVLIRIFTKVNRVLTGRSDVKCASTKQPNKEAPAWSDGVTVTFNLSKVGSVSSVDDIVRLTGLNYHELSHLMFTPREGSWLIQRVRQANAFVAFNILEDQRIETLMTGMYPATAPYFVTIFMSYCLRDEDQWENNFLLAHGRRFLPREVRQQFADKFKLGPKARKQAAKIIDEYRMLSLTNNSYETKGGARALELCIAFRDLMQGLKTGDPFGHFDRPKTLSAAGTVTWDEQNEAAEWARYIEAEKDHEDEDGGRADSSSADEADDDSGDGESDQGPSGAGDGSEQDGGTEHGGSSDTSDQPDRDRAGGRQAGTASSPFRELLKDALKGASQSEDVQREAHDKQNQIVNGDGDVDIALDKCKYNQVRVSESSITIASKFAREIEQLRAEMDPGWKTHRSSGRVNVQRAMSGNFDLDTVFDQWNEGVNDSADIECVIELDVSGSMVTDIVQACESMWVIKRALDRANASVTVLVFNTNASCLYDLHDKADPRRMRGISAMGGTDPSEALCQAAKVLQASKRRHKMNIVITDGDWSGVKPDEVIGRMNAVGVTTAIAHINGISKASHNCQVVCQVKDTIDLIPFAKAIVKDIMKGGK